MFTQTRSQLQSSTQASSATLHHSSSISARSHKPSRKPVFRVFCDEDTLEPTPTAEPAHHRKLKSSAALQTVVNNKENQVPELNNRTISASRPPARSSTRSRVLGEKSLTASARVNCVEQWDSIVPFAPCRSSPGKLNKLEPIKTERVASHSQFSKEPQKKPKTIVTPAKPTKRLSSHIYCRATDQASQLSTHSQPVDDGLLELVSKLEALQTHHDEPLEPLDPLPPNATCPGAPKIPSAFTMPLFVADDGFPDDEQILKSPNSHQMSPLAEVTEAFTGLQGGWSPPLETLSPVMHDHAFDPTSFLSNLS